MIRALFLFLFFAASSATFGQGAHYTYPFSISCPDELMTAGQPVTVVAMFEGGHRGERYAPIYNWSLSQGTIMSGQGTTSITVEIGRENIGQVIVTLDRVFNEAHFPDVQRSANCTLAVAPWPEARMFDEFRTAGNNCEEGFARLDSFFVELNNNPVDTGLIAVYGDAGDKRAARRRATQLRNHFKYRNFDLNRIRMVFGRSRENGTTQFWMIPPGAEAPMIEAEVPVPEIERPTETTLYAAEYTDGVGGCNGNIFDLAAYAAVLKTDTANVARIVIGQSSQAKYRRKANEIIAELRRLGIPRAKIVTVYKYVRPNRMLEMTELWIVPPKG
jgi:hypothetical protein